MNELNQIHNLTPYIYNIELNILSYISYTLFQWYSHYSSDIPIIPVIFPILSIEIYTEILWMEEILHQLVTIGNYKTL